MSNREREIVRAIIANYTDRPGLGEVPEAEVDDAIAAALRDHAGLRTHAATVDDAARFVELALDPPNALSRSLVQGIRELAAPPEDAYLIRSAAPRSDYALWWRPRGAGYTAHVDEAGVYTRAQAEAQARERKIDTSVSVAVARTNAVLVVPVQRLR